MGHNLSLNISSRRVLGAVAAGHESKDCCEVDVSGFEGVRFVAFLGATSENSKARLRVLSSDTSCNYGEGSGAKEIACSAQVIPGDDDHKMIIIDIYRPCRRYLKATVLLSDGDTAIDGVIAECYRPLISPVKVDSSIAQQVIMVDEK